MKWLKAEKRLSGGGFAQLRSLAWWNTIPSRIQCRRWLMRWVKASAGMLRI